MGEKCFLIRQVLLQSWFFLNLEPGAEFVVDNNSQLILEPNSRIDIGQNAILRVKRGGRLVINTGAVINVNDGKIIIEDDGYVNYFPNCTVNLDGNVAVFEINGMLKLEDNATLRLNRTTSNHGFFVLIMLHFRPQEMLFVGLIALLILVVLHKAGRLFKLIKSHFISHRILFSLI